MTREKIISNLLYMKRSVKEDTIEDRTIDEAIKALEQEPILDKVRAEIDAMPCAITSMREIYVRRDKVINILDKYRAESEDKCKNCEYYHNPDYTRCHKCKAESEGSNADSD